MHGFGGCDGRASAGCGLARRALARRSWWRWAPPMVLLLAAAASAEDRPAPAPPVPASATEILAAVRAPGAAGTLVNMWATWCVPCREEFPDLLRLRSAYRERGLRVLLVSGDFDSERPQVEAFLREQGVD